MWRNRRAQLAADANGAAGIDDGHATIADDEANIGDVIVAGGIQCHLSALVNINAGSQLRHIERIRGASRGDQGANQQQKTLHADQCSDACSVTEPPSQVAVKCALVSESTASTLTGEGNACAAVSRSDGFSLKEIPVSASSSVPPAVLMRICEI